MGLSELVYTHRKQKLYFLHSKDPKFCKTGEIPSGKLKKIKFAKQKLQRT